MAGKQNCLGVVFRCSHPRSFTFQVKPTVYLEYVRAATYLFSISFFLLFCSFQALQISRSVWLSKWADDNEPGRHSGNFTPTGLGIRLGVYASLGVGEAIAFSFAVLALLFGGQSASKNLHSPLLNRILRAPMSFFDTTPLGRIMNRFGKDVDVIDVVLTLSFRYFIMCLTQVCGTLFVITFTTPIFIIVIIPLGVLYGWALKFYVPTSRQMRRLESNNRSPVYSHFGETIQGISTIRAFGKGDEFAEHLGRRVDRVLRIRYLNLVANRWLGIRLEFIGNCVVLFAALFAALGGQWGISAGLVGLSVSYSLNITEVLNFAVRQVSDLETNIVSVERLKEYSEIGTEAPWHIEGETPPDGWPSDGRIEFRNYSTRYRPELELVVRGIGIEINSSEKVGIVGRTGAGKSSLTLALFRMIEPVEGTIVIDGVDIRRIGLHDLRQNLTIIPQEPVLFSATLRFNLDPFDRHSDDELWQALELAHLKTFVASLPNGLSHPISEGGDNISIGQRQLVCLARALLRRSHILVLDEATAAVDLATDALIQETIRQEFRHSTVFTIAHRLNTVVDYDRILVMDRGEAREFDAPSTLLDNRSSLFSSLATDAKIRWMSKKRTS